jgi:uncharacterized protein
MRSILLLFFLIISGYHLIAQTIPSRTGSERMVHDYSEMLTEGQREELDVLANEIRMNQNIECYVILFSKKINKDAWQFAEKVGSEWKLPENRIVIVADLHYASYGFNIGNEVSSTYASWILEKIEHNYLRANFREKKYFEGIKEALNIFSEIKSGKLDPEDLKKENSSTGLLLLLVIIVFFIIIFPVLQYRAMKKSHFSTRPVDFVSSVLLMNNFGTRGKNVFDNFTKGKGVFETKEKGFPAGGAGVTGNW